jgi:hypothetical protein
MDATQPQFEAAMERLRAEIAALRERLADSARLVEARWLDMLLAETPIAEHAYRLARDGHDRVRGRLGELESALGALILELEVRQPSGRRPA